MVELKWVDGDDDGFGFWELISEEEDEVKWEKMEAIKMYVWQMQMHSCIKLYYDYESDLHSCLIDVSSYYIFFYSTIAAKVRNICIL